MTTKSILIILNVAGLIGSLIWLMVNPGWEPVVTSIGLVATLIAQINSGGDEKRNLKMRQKGGKRSTNYQSGGDINVQK